MNSIIRYIFAKEVYRKYSENKDGVADYFTGSNIWGLIFTILGIITIISYSIRFSKKNDLTINHLDINDSLYVNDWKISSYNEIPVYRKGIKRNEYLKLDTIVIDTIVAFNQSLKIDSTFQSNKAIGIYNGEVIKNKHDKYLIGFKKTKNLKLTKATERDFTYDEKYKYLDNLYISIDTIKKRNTKDPEERWFQHFLYLIVAFFTFRNLITAVIRLLKRKIPVYERVPVYKKDNRYSSGQRIVRWDSVLKEFRKFSKEELTLHKSQQYSKIIFNGILLVFSICLLLYLYV